MKKTIVFWCTFLSLVGLILTPVTWSNSLISGNFLSLPRTTYYLDETVVLSWSDTPGNQQDWVTIIPAGTRDNTFGEWTYTGGERLGTFEVTGLAPGQYEARLYFDWPDGGYEVIERLFFTVEETPETASEPEVVEASPDMKATEEAATPERETMASGTGSLSISGNIEYHSEIDLALGRQTFSLENLSPQSSLSFGGTARLVPLYTFKLGATWKPEPGEVLRAFFQERGFSDTNLASFLALDRESQIVFLTPREQLAEGLLEGKLPDPEQIIQSLPADVQEELIALNAFQDRPSETFYAEILVEVTTEDGSSQRSYGAGMVELMLNENTDGPWFVFDGEFWGGYDGEAGYGQIQGRFHALPYDQEMHVHVTDQEQTLIQRDKTTTTRNWDWNASEPDTSWMETIWTDQYPVKSISVSIDHGLFSQSLDHLSHELTFLLLNEDDQWVVVFETVLLPDNLLTIDHPALTGTPPREGNYSLPERLIAEAHLPNPVLAGGVRFELHGIPFTGDNWRLNVYSAPVPYQDGTVDIEWRYDHAW